MEGGGCGKCGGKREWEGRGVMTFAKKGGCEDSGREVPEEKGVVIAGAAVIIVRGAVEWLSGSDVVLVVDEGKVVIEVVE